MVMQKQPTDKTSLDVARREQIYFSSPARREEARRLALRSGFKSISKFVNHLVHLYEQGKLSEPNGEAKPA